jgi:type IV pilus assembly protein PilE
MNTTQDKSMGFSLIEMMITLAILAIIVSFAIPVYLRYTENTRLTQARTVISQIQQDIQSVKLIEGSLGGDNTAIVSKVTSILENNKSKSIINQNELNQFYAFNVVAGSSTGQYFFNVTPIDTSKKGLYMDQSGNAFKCPSAAEVSSHSGCEKM